MGASAPDRPPPPQAPAPPPEMDVKDVEDQRRVAAEERERSKLRRGRAATILTTPKKTESTFGQAGTPTAGV